MVNAKQNCLNNRKLIYCVIESKNMGEFMKKYLNKSLNKTPNVIDI